VVIVLMNMRREGVRMMVMKMTERRSFTFTLYQMKKKCGNCTCAFLCQYFVVPVMVRKNAIFGC
jgi:hypothetical protein